MVILKTFLIPLQGALRGHCRKKSRTRQRNKRERKEEGNNTLKEIMKLKGKENEG
jgi:hypothetical protein